MARKITRAERDAARSKPTTGDGVTGGQKPKMSETNLPGRHSAVQFVARLIRRSTGGKHQG